jgi:Virulence factor BrkB
MNMSGSSTAPTPISRNRGRFASLFRRAASKDLRDRTAFLWLIASAGFPWYAANFGSYNETYGTLGAAIGLMTWLWISINIVLVGGEINSQLEERVEPEKAKAQP